MKNIWKITIGLNIVAASVAVWNLLRLGAGSGPDIAAEILIGVIVFGLLLGPYLVLSLLAVVLRKNRGLSIVLLVLVVLTAAAFLTGQIVETNVYQANQQLNGVGKGQRVGNFLLFIGQWAVSVGLGVVLVVIHLCQTALTKKIAMEETPGQLLP